MDLNLLNLNDDEEEELDLFHQKNLPLLSFPLLEQLRAQGRLVDVSLKINEHVFIAHRVVLAATIPYFHAMFTHDMVESKQSEITLQGIDANALELIINFAYSGKITMSASNVQSLIVASSYLQMDQIRDACCNFLKKRLKLNNVLSTLQFADSLGCVTLVEAANNYIFKHFVQVSQLDEFLSLPFIDVLEIISSDELHVTNEEQVFEAVMHWIKKDEIVRKEYLPNLLTKVRMPLLTPNYLTDRVATEELIRTSHKCRDILDEAKDYYLMPERRPLLQSFRIRPRCCNDIVGMIYAVGGLTKSGDSISTVEVFDPIVGRWQITESMTMLRSRVGVVVLNNKMYAIGGYNGQERLRTVEVFDPVIKSWSKVAQMHCKRSAVGATVLDGKIYVCGGYDGISSLNSVECYNPEKNEWTLVSCMSKHRSAAGVTTLNGCIYAIGGHDGLSIFDSVERYDPQMGLWSPVTSMLTKRCRLGVATLKGKLYVCGGYDGSTFLRTMEVFDSVCGHWTHVAPMNVTRSRVALVSNYGQLYAIGGYDGLSNLSTMETYNPDLNFWNFCASMSAHEGGVGVGVIPLM